MPPLSRRTAFAYMIEACSTGDELKLMQVMNTALVTPETVLDDLESTGIHYAAAFGHQKIVDLLIQYAWNGAEICCRTNLYGWNSLHQACYNGKLEMVKYLLSMPRMKSSAVTGYNVSLIELAVCSGNCDLVRFLAKKNLPVEKSALILAIGNLDMCLTLLEHSTAIQTEILEGISAAQNCPKMFGNYLKMTGIEPLQVAATCGDLETCQLLVSYGADPNRVDANGLSAFDFALYSGMEAVQAFLDPITTKKQFASLDEKDVVDAVVDNDVVKLKDVLTRRPELVKYRRSDTVEIQK